MNLERFIFRLLRPKMFPLRPAIKHDDVIWGENYVMSSERPPSSIRHGTAISDSVKVFWNDLKLQKKLEKKIKTTGKFKIQGIWSPCKQSIRPSQAEKPFTVDVVLYFTLLRYFRDVIHCWTFCILHRYVSPDSFNMQYPHVYLKFFRCLVLYKYKKRKRKASSKVAHTNIRSPQNKITTKDYWTKITMISPWNMIGILRGKCYLSF